MVIHLPTGILLKTFVESSKPVIAPDGESNKDKPRPASVRPSRSFIPGMEATHIPNKRLDEENRKPTASTGFNFIKERKFFNIMNPNLLD